ncbi:MAG: hypothetical protein P8X43_09510 [Maritimibacter sp.]
MLNILKAEGYSSVEILDPGELLIKINGRPHMLFVEDDGDLRAYYGISGVKVTCKDTNTWNRTRRLSRAFIDDENDPVLKELYGHLLMVWIDGGEAHTNELIRRFVKAPKPMYYAPDVLNTFWAEYLRENKVATSDVDPDDFMRASYAKALVHRQPIYAKMAENWGLRITAEQVSKVKSAEDFETLIAEALEAR